MHFYSQAMPLDGNDFTSKNEADKALGYGSVNGDDLSIQGTLSSILGELDRLNNRLDSLEKKVVESSADSCLLHTKSSLDPPSQLRASENPCDSSNLPGSAQGDSRHGFV